MPAGYIGKPVSLRVYHDNLQIYYSTNLIAEHGLSNKKLNYNKEHYKQLLAKTMHDADSIDALAEKNLKQMDCLL